jgi:uncharacterized membrane protein YdbT with pleckstrin-like domain
MEHRSRIDWWLITLLGGMILICLFGGAYLIAQRQDWLLGVAAMVVGLAMVAQIVPIRYHITDDQLRVRAGVFLWRIPLAAIREVHPSNNPLFAPALSVKRLNVRYAKPSGRGAFVLIAPRDREAFVRDLRTAHPGLQQLGDRLVRRPGQPPTEESTA